MNRGGLRADDGERGSALVSVMLVALLVGAAALSTWQLGRTRLQAAQARTAHARAASVARGAARAVAAWFEWSERGGLVAPPDAALVDRGARVLDEDGDGAGTLWSSASGTRRVRYKEGGGALFRPPDGPALEDVFVGTREGPDLALDAADDDARAVLTALAAAIDPGGGAAIERVAFFRAPAGASADVLCSVEVAVAVPRPGAAPARARARAEIARVEWLRPERAIVSEGDLRLEGEAAWRRGEAVAGGDLDAPASTWGAWPGGIPWLGLDAPLRDDADGDGAADDADGDGLADLEAWRADAGAVPDPWWRARVAGAFSGAAGAGPGCGPAIPFGPRRSPPAPASKVADRSGILTGCPVDAGSAVSARWVELARLGVRGALLVEEVAGAAGLFRLVDGAASGVLLPQLVPPAGGLVVAEAPAAGAGASALTLTLDGQRGALVVLGRDVAIEAGSARDHEGRVPGSPRDTAGDDRPGGDGDDWLPVAETISGCGGWEVSAWEPAGSGSPAGVIGCGNSAVHWHGLLATDRALDLRSGVRVLGQIRGAEVGLSGVFGASEVVADAGPGPLAASRPGPPGAPRAVAFRVRLAR